MEKNVEIRIEKEKDGWLLVATLKERIFENILIATACPIDRLKYYMIPEDNCFLYKLADMSMPKGEVQSIVDTIEQIANEKSEEEMWNTLLTDNMGPMMPAKMHKMMKKRGLTGATEWYTSLFFVNLGGIITDPAFCYRSIEEDIKAGDCDIFTVTTPV